MQTDRGKKRNEIRMRLFKMVSVGVVDDPINQGYDIVSTLMLIVNLIGAFANTFDGVRAQYASLLDLTEEITVAFFALDYALRLMTAKCLYPQLTEGRALAKYMLSAGGIVDLLSFLPFYLPFFSRAARRRSGCSAWRVFSACSASMRIMIRSTSSPRSSSAKSSSFYRRCSSFSC